MGWDGMGWDGTDRIRSGEVLLDRDPDRAGLEGPRYQVAHTTTRDPIAVTASNATVPARRVAECRGDNRSRSIPEIQKSRAADA